MNIKENNRIEHLDVIANKLGDTIPKSHGHIKLSVIIPAKNESAGILNTLIALKNQKGICHLNYAFKNYEVFVLCHNCTDDTYGVCEKFSAEHPDFNLYPLVLNSSVATTVGAARRILMNIASKRLTFDDGLIVSTDADTIPDAYWLYNLDHYLSTHIAMVCGLINVNHEGLKKQASRYLASKDAYLLLKAKLESIMLPNPKDPWPRHAYNWGPNLALKKYVYNAVGGIKPLHFLEDVDLYNRVYSAGFSIRHCMNTTVHTSVRTDSRCDEGFGAELKVWSDYDDVDYNVESLDKLICRYKIYHLIAEYYQFPNQKILTAIHDLSYIEIEKIRDLFNRCERQEAMVIKIQELLNSSQEWNVLFPNINVDEACGKLTQHFEFLENTTSST
ncbi:MAG: glycosyltransferase family 2 protein [Gelidibacter sp.]